MVYGYCRISTPRQVITRQVENISKTYSDAVIVEEIFTGTKQNRPKWKELLKRLKPGDTVVFDSVSRMSRNASEGVQEYLELYDRGIELVFLKEPLINTQTYKSALSNSIPLTGSDIDDILAGVNSYLKKLATRQIELSFQQSEKEVLDLHQRTSEGLRTAKESGKRIGQPKGAKLITKKSIVAKKIIQQHCKTFGGSLQDKEVAKLAGICLNSLYRYKRQIRAEIEKNSSDIHLEI